MVTLCKRKHEMSDDTLMDLVTEAFPVVAFAKQLEDTSRKIMEIMECVIQPDGSRQYNTLYHFAIEDNRCLLYTSHIRLRDALMRIEGKFLLSYNDDEFIRSLYDRPGIYLSLIHILCSATNLLELNDLAERLSRLNEVQRIAFEGLVRVDFQKQESITLKRLRDLTESVDCCHVVERCV